MSRIYDGWERLVGAVLRREEDRQLALCESFSSSSSADFTPRSSFSSNSFRSSFCFNPCPSSFSFNPFVRDFRNDYKNSGERLDPADLSCLETLFFRNVMAIEYEELKTATRNFHPCELLGEGAFRRIYKGWILTATKPRYEISVAIKKTYIESYEWNREFLDEIYYLSELRHPNLIKLIGYSFNADNRILVYEFMRKGSLDNHLFTRGRNSLNWETRIKVAIGAARAIAFLHDLEIPVIHRNIKSSNILLDGEFNTKLSGFALARDAPTGDTTHLSTRVMGTYGYAAPEYVATGYASLEYVATGYAPEYMETGYAAPEYVATGHLTTRCDVYSFGAVLLELMTGLRIFDYKRPVGERDLIIWAKPYLSSKNKLSRIVDCGLEGKYPPKEACKVAKICLQCLNVESRLRPKMSEVVVVLESL